MADEWTMSKNRFHREEFGGMLVGGGLSAPCGCNERSKKECRTHGDGGTCQKTTPRESAGRRVEQRAHFK